MSRCGFQPQDAASTAPEKRCDGCGHGGERAGGGGGGSERPSEIRHHIHGQLNAHNGTVLYCIPSS